MMLPSRGDRRVTIEDEADATFVGGARAGPL